MLHQLGEIQIELERLGLEGWLLCDFRGQNPVVRRALGLGDRTLTRRYLYWLPAQGMPVLVVHDIEVHSFPQLPGEVVQYSGWTTLREALSRVLPARGRIAMEYCPMASNPYLSRVDAGTVELVRSYGPTPVSSGDLVQRFLCRWGADEVTSHARAAHIVSGIRAEALMFVAEGARRGEPRTEAEVQDRVLSRFAEALVVTEGRPVVASGPNTGDPHHRPPQDGSRLIVEGDLLLLDLWARELTENGVFAQSCWVAFVGKRVPERFARAFEVVVQARDRAIELIRTRHAEDKRVCGFEVDRAAREVMARAGLAERFVHRTGHYLGRDLSSGDACTFDDLEIHDTREVAEGLAWSIHPGLYWPDDFGVRSSVDVMLTADGPDILGPTQTEIEALLVG